MGNIIYVSRNKELNEIASKMGCCVPVVSIADNKVGFKRLESNIWKFEGNKESLKIRKIEESSKIKLSLILYFY